MENTPKSDIRSLFAYNSGYGFFWFKFFGKYGILIRDKNKTTTLFSERNGYSTFKDFGRFRFKILR